MNWLFVHKKNDPKMKLMISKSAILAVHFEYHENKLEKIIIFVPGKMFQLDTTFDHDRLLTQLGVKNFIRLSV